MKCHTYTSGMKRAFIVVLLTFLAITPASAHSVLESSTPAADSSLETFPTVISLTFNEPLMQLGTEKIHTVAITDPDGGQVALDNTVINENTITSDVVSAPTFEGVYTVKYRIVSADGHPVDGTFTFAYKVPASASPTPNRVSGTSSRETGRAAMVFLVLAAVALLAYRKFDSRS